MEKSLVVILLLAGLCEDASCQTRKYNLVNITKNWTDARSYCREKHTDLVTVRSLEEQQQILNVAKDYEFWIGLYRDSDKWQWSTGDAVSYTKWTADSDSLFCATADATGSWDKSFCRDLKPFMCYNETSNITERYTLISTPKTWPEAQQYCRQHHTDLVSIKSASENEDIKKKAPASPFWIGLFNNPWTWADEENSTFQNWNTVEPNGGSEKCVLMYSPNQGKWEDWPCSYWKYFVCYEGLCENASCPNRTYIPVRTLKTWTDASSYCREKYTDLATVRSLEEQQQILNVAKDDRFWIGLYRDSDNWQWSTGDAVSYTKYVAGSDSLYCAIADAAGSWDKSSCRDQRPFMCYNETSNITERYTPISTLKTWAEAQQYCRQHHTDLVSIKSASENEDMKKKAPTSPFWIGLFNNPWKWTDGGNSTFQNWNTFEPNGAIEKCVLMFSPNQGKWEDWPCSYWKYFVCYDGLCENASCPNRTYIPVRTLKTWTDARSYCREKHTDLVTVRSLKEQQQILNVAKDDRFWIGLYRDSENWQWSTGDAVSYTKWTASSDSLFCATADATGSWDKSSCRDQRPFMCYNETSNITERYTLISTPKTWPEAQQYCRQHHTDLVSIKSASENEDMKKKAPASPFWIGLFNNPWKWTDEGNSTFQNWNTFEPTAGSEKCVLMYSPNQGKWKDWPCSYETYFFCYDESNSTTTAPETTTKQSTETTERSTETQTSPGPEKRRQVIRIEIKAPEGMDPEEPKIRDAILAQLQEHFFKNTPMEGTTLRWIKKDGKIFHKQEEEEEEEKETETCSKP